MLALALGLVGCGLEQRTLGEGGEGGGGGGTGNQGAGTGGTASEPDAGQGGGGDSTCTQACVAPNATTQCVSGVCSISACGIGFFDCNGQLSDGCEVASVPVVGVPALRGPENGAYTGSLHAAPARSTLKPALRWREVDQVCGSVSYAVQLDDSCAPGALAACTFPSPEVDARGLAQTGFIPAQDLPVSTQRPMGAFYAWRVRACDASTRCSDWTLPRYLNVGRLLQDLDGDGYADVIAQSTQTAMSPRVEVFRGSSQFDQEADVQLPSGTSVPTFLGDVNGDGYADAGAIVGYAPTSGQVPEIVFGGPDFASFCDRVGNPCITLTSSAGGPSSSIGVQYAGDINADGYTDVLIETNAGASNMQLYWGAPTLASNPALRLPSPLAEMYSIARSGGVGDLDGDGYAELALVTSGSVPSNVYLLRGGGAPTAFEPPVPLGVSCGGAYLAPGGDVNADDLGDFLLSCDRVAAYAYLGAAPLPAEFAATLLSATVKTVAGNFDVDADGVSDVLVGVTGAPSMLYLGRRGFDLDAPEAGAMASLGSASVLSVSDQNGDGLWDFVSGGTSVRRANGNGTFNPNAAGTFVTSGGYSVTGPPAR